MADQSNNKNNNNNQGNQPRDRNNRQGQASRDRSRSPSQDTRRPTRDRSPIRDSGSRGEAPQTSTPQLTIQINLQQQGNLRAGQNSAQRGGAKTNVVTPSLENGLVSISSNDMGGVKIVVNTVGPVCNASGSTISPPACCPSSLRCYQARL